MEALTVGKSVEKNRTLPGISPGLSGHAEANTHAPSPKDPALLKAKMAEMSDRVEQETREKVEKIGEIMDDYDRSSQRSLSIQVDGNTGDTIVKVISKEDGRIIREIPPEEMRNLVAKMEATTGLLFDRKV